MSVKNELNIDYLSFKRVNRFIYAILTALEFTRPNKFLLL